MPPQLLQLLPILCDSMNCSSTSFSGPWDPPDKNTGWVAMPSSRGSSRLGDPTWVSCIAGKFFTAEPLGKPLLRHSDF